MRSLRNLRGACDFRRVERGDLRHPEIVGRTAQTESALLQDVCTDHGSPHVAMLE